MTSAFVALTGLTFLQSGADSAGAAPAPAPPVVIMPRAANADSLAAAVEAVIDDNLFRADRSSVDAAAPTAPVNVGMPAISAKPRLVLRGILGGPPWDALIEGVPGHDGALVVRTGQSVAGLSIRAVRRDTVIVRGFDTTWALALGNH